MSKPKNKDKAVARGWVGRWHDGTLGWFMPHHVGHGMSEYPVRNSNCAGEPCYRVKITVELLRDKRGNPIVRKFPKAQP